jgi:hypothetical protein
MWRDVDAEIYPCADCGVMRSEKQGAKIFTVCSDCWDKQYSAAPSGLSGATASAKATIKPVTFEEMKATSDKLREGFLDTFTGLPITCDLTGLFCGDDGYVMLVGKKLWEELAARSKR